MCIEANDTNHALDNPLSLILQSFKRNIKTSMAIDDKNQDEKLRHDINRETAKLFSLSSGKINNYEYLAGKEILLSHQGRMIEQAYLLSFRKSFQKQIKQFKIKEKNKQMLL